MTPSLSERLLVETLAPTSRKEFFDSYTSDPAAAGFTAFLFGQPVEIPIEPDFSNAHTASLAIFTAFQTGDDTLFREVYSELSRRQLRADAPWWMNDPLMFGLVLCAVRFGGDTSWLRNTLRFRIEHSTHESHDTALTFSDILLENWGSETNLRSLVLVSRHLLCLGTTESSLLNSVYHMVTETPFPFYESNFLNSICLRAFDVVILSKAPQHPERTRALEQLVDTAWRRSRTSGWIAWWFILLCLVGLFARLLFWVKGLNEGSMKQWIETLSLIGIPIMAILPIWPWISKRERIVSKVQQWEAARFYGLDMEVLCPTRKKPIRLFPAQHNHLNAADSPISEALEIVSDERGKSMPVRAGR